MFADTMGLASVCDEDEEGHTRQLPKHDNYPNFYVTDDYQNTPFFFHRIGNLLYTVMCRGCCTKKTNEVYMVQATKTQRMWSPLFGWGHFETFNAWSHLIGFVAFVLYAILRHALFYQSSVSFAWATGAAASTAVTFLSSVVYHCTTPDMHISMLTRQLDFVAVYVSIAVCSVADLAAVTRGFVNVPIVSIVDVPIAATVLALFFAFRRHELSANDTWTKGYTECRLGAGGGLMRCWHSDKDHTPLRQAGSFAIASFYFTVTPAVLQSSLDAAIVLGLQVGAMVVVVGGMLLDNVAEWPDYALHKRKNTDGMCCTSFPFLGCVLTSHGLWHILAILAAVMTSAAREWAVFSHAKGDA